MVLQALGRVLEVENYWVVSARNQREALRQLRIHPIDVVLLDLDPRNGNPWETLHLINSLHPNLPIVAMTARLEQQNANFGARELDALLEKPPKLLNLIQTLNHLTLQTQGLRTRRQELLPSLS